MMMNDMSLEMTEGDILEAVQATGTTSSFCSNQTYLTNKFGRKPNRLERLVLTNTLKKLNDVATRLPSNSSCTKLGSSISSVDHNESISSSDVTVMSEKILVCTAYSEDYTIGRLCELVNREYATRHG